MNLKRLFKITSGLCGSIIGIECLARLYGSRESKKLRSYHITKNRRFIWPKNLFFNFVCTDYEEAKKAYDKYIEKNPNKSYHLVSYPIIIKGILFYNIVGANSSSGKIHNENKC